MNITLNLKPFLILDNEAFEQLCHHNPEMRLERAGTGELIAMVPVDSESGAYNLSLSAQLWFWNLEAQWGIAFDSSAGFTLPNGAIRSPDASWIQQVRWERLTPQQKRKFAPICPDFVLELMSPSDDLTVIQGKLEEYRDNGAQLGWLIAPETQEVHIYRSGQPIEILNRPNTLSGEEILPGFVLNIETIWPQG
jgi:Uma2 family endonuclease